MYEFLYRRMKFLIAWLLCLALAGIAVNGWMAEAVREKA